ncbi:MAG TPA: hypothetical protein VMZ05_06105 [Spirochaetota bacterium]|nr:hypothetical protein [Spirochaetota bacterium]
MRKIIIISLVALLFTIGCQHDMLRLEKGNLTATQRVLIAGTTSEFKQNVVTRVMEKLGTVDYYFKIIGLDQLDKEETEQYGAILLVATFAAGQIDGRVTQFLQKDTTSQKVIVFYTYGSEDAGIPDWAKPDIKVDAVTSASLPNRVEERADELVILIKNRFNSQ